MRATLTFLLFLIAATSTGEAQSTTISATATILESVDADPVAVQVRAVGPGLEAHAVAAPTDSRILLEVRLSDSAIVSRLPSSRPATQMTAPAVHPPGKPRPLVVTRILAANS